MPNPTNDNLVLTYAKVDFSCTGCGKLIMQDHFVKLTKDAPLVLSVACSHCFKSATVTILNGIGTIS